MQHHPIVNTVEPSGYSALPRHKVNIAEPSGCNATQTNVREYYIALRMRYHSTVPQLQVTILLTITILVFEVEVKKLILIRNLTVIHFQLLSLQCAIIYDVYVDTGTFL